MGAIPAHNSDLRLATGDCWGSLLDMAVQVFTSLCVNEQPACMAEPSSTQAHGLEAAEARRRTTEDFRNVGTRGRGQKGLR
jgi:hypothetical protein